MLVDVYAKNVVAWRMPGVCLRRCRSVLWNAMIVGYAQLNQGDLLLQPYTQMQQEGVVPNDWTCVSLLKACGSQAERNEGDSRAVKERCLETIRAIHADVVKANFESDVFVGTMLVDIYAKCGSLEDAMNVFEKMPHRDVVSWNAMIMGYAQMDKGEISLQSFARMQKEGMVPNDRTYVSVLKACSSLAESEEGNEGDGIVVKESCLEIVSTIHKGLVKAEFESDVFVATMLVDAWKPGGSQGCLREDAST